MNKQWAKCALIRAVKTVAQTMVAVIGTSTMIESVDFKLAISSALLAGLVSVLTSVAGLPEVESSADTEQK